ncbi:MAG TPA: cyclase family protein [Candidatus Acidoferrum sp.]|nr:cyclase family protein [Candidatus Acidoferrum sp.]
MEYVDLTQPFIMLPLRKSSIVRKHQRSLETHIESPALIRMNGKTIDAFGPERLVRSAVLLDLRSKVSKGVVDDEDLEGAEEGAGLAIRDGEIAIIQTGWEQFYSQPKRYRAHPALSMNAAEYLSFKGVTAVGIDAPSVDLPTDSKLRVHSVLFRRKILVIENLRNLDLIEEPRFQLLALPLNLKAARSPARVIAVQANS